MPGLGTAQGQYAAKRDGVGDGTLDGGTPMTARGLASLDVALPVRGVEYLFTTPRGDIEITARPLDAALLERIVRLGAVLLVFLIIGLAYRFVSRVGFDHIVSRPVAILLLVGGVMMLVWGVAPLLAITLIAFGIVQFLRLTLKRFAARKASLAAV